MSKRFCVCRLPGPAEGVFAPDTERIEGADFDSREEAERFVGSFPGSGHGYIYDSTESFPVSIVSWERKERAN